MSILSTIPERFRSEELLQCVHPGGEVTVDSVKDVGKQTDYFSYLLRLWRDSDDTALWRASLQSPHTGERIHFASFEELLEYLRRQTTASTQG